MPRPILRIPQKSESQSSNSLNLSAHYRGGGQKANTLDKMKLDRILRKKRSKEYLNVMHKLDAGGHVHNQDKVKAIIDTIKKEFPEIEICRIILGYVSVCYLGKPYEVHTLDITGEIIEHYKAGEMLPNGLEKARNIAIRGGYDFIEVYIDCCRAISSDGTVSVIPS